MRWLGPFERDEIGRVLGEIDLLIVPSIWPENSPVTIHEARAARVPVLAAEIGGMPELVREGRAGWCFSPGDAADLRRWLETIAASPAMLERTRAETRPVKSIAENAQEIEALYARIVRTRRIQRVG